MPSSRRNWLIFWGMACGYACTILDTTIVHVALPSISTQLHADLLDTAWVVHAYNLAFVVCLIMAGHLADQWGRKPLFLGGISLFGVSSLACALAPSLVWLIGFRIVQAMGGACLGGVGFAIVSSLFVDYQQRARALGIWSAIAAVSAITGPLLGGLVVPLSWRWIFLINLPCCVLGVLLTLCFLPGAQERADVSRHVDGVGMILLAGTLLPWTLALVQGSEWGEEAVWLLVLLGTLSLGCFLLVEYASPFPFVPFSLFRVRTFTASCIGMFLFWSAYQGATILLSLYFLIAQRRTPEATALLLMAVPLANILTSLFFPRALPAWIRAGIGISCAALGFVLLAVLSPVSVWYATILPEVLIGIGAACSFTSFHLLVMSEVQEQGLGQASGIFNVCRQLATTLGAAVLLWSMNAHLFAGLRSLSQLAGTALQTEESFPFVLRQQAADRLANLFSRVMYTGGMVGQVPSLFDDVERQQWTVWLGQQVHLVVVTAFAQTWLLSGVFACATYFVLPFLRQKVCQEDRTEGVREDGRL